MANFNHFSYVLRRPMWISCKKLEAQNAGCAGQFRGWGRISGQLFHGRKIRFKQGAMLILQLFQVRTGWALGETCMHVHVMGVGCIQKPVPEGSSTSMVPVLVFSSIPNSSCSKVSLKMIRISSSPWIALTRCLVGPWFLAQSHARDTIFLG